MVDHIQDFPRIGVQRHYPIFLTYRSQSEQPSGVHSSLGCWLLAVGVGGWGLGLVRVYNVHLVE